jgi:hypothetical protein
MRLRPLALLAVAAIGLCACGDDRSDPPAGFFGVAPLDTQNRLSPGTTILPAWVSQRLT